MQLVQMQPETKFKRMTAKEFKATLPEGLSSDQKKQMFAESCKAFHVKSLGVIQHHVEILGYVAKRVTCLKSGQINVAFVPPTTAKLTLRQENAMMKAELASLKSANIAA